MPCAGYALERNIINITATGSIHFFNALIAAIRRQEENRVNIPCLQQSDALFASSGGKSTVKTHQYLGALCGIGKIS